MSIKRPNRIARIFDGILNFSAVLAAALVVLVTLGIAGDVAGRFFFNRPIFAMIEIAEYSLVWITFLLAAWVLRREKHVKMDIVLIRLKPTVQRLLNIITSALSAIAFLIITWYAVVVTWRLYTTNYHDWTNLQPLLWPIYLIFPIGSFLVVLQLLIRIRGYWKNRPAGTNGGGKLTSGGQGIVVDS